MLAVREALASRPHEAVDKLNGGWMEALLTAGRYVEVEEFANTGTVAMARDTWPVEQLQRFRVRALRAAGKPGEALAAAKGLYFVSGNGSVPYCIQLLCDCLRDAYPADPGVVNRFKLQQLALAAEDEAVRKAQSADLGPLVLDNIKIDPKPFEKATEQRAKTGYDNLYGTGNLLLLGGRTKEAADVFRKVYDIGPANETTYATEGLAKAMRAEDGAVGRSNAFVRSVRPNDAEGK